MVLTVLASQANEKLLVAITAQQRPTYLSQKTTHQQCQPSSSKRPASPITDHSESLHKRSKSFHTQEKTYSENDPLPACAVCLSCEMHSVPVIECNASTTWDHKHDVFVKQINKTLVVKSTGQRLCSQWQCKDGCSDKHAHAHLCSSCRSAAHGAQNCP
ncbi:hypothetical protein SCLCIDRAFT_142389 [Scleroderma citrinum Foug A]|uniref:Uncharacterized protein n=1 Tax=Scleroderma citrinum Foug A TaxID=1036808 RepID=A0A0C2ZG25_9AGAM|nr:hypothetical protein SCLCIDRAFT_142389 [Scleroderma citrinum Foug A]